MDDVSVLDLFREIALAKQRMSVSNPHREVFAKCEAAIWHLSKELHELKAGLPTVARPDEITEGAPV